MSSLRRYAFLSAAILFSLTAGTLLFGQQKPAPSSGSASQSSEQQMQENQRALRTRKFLGLGKLPNAKAAAAGAKIFAQNCSFCHGPDARGGEGPDLLTAQIVLDDEGGDKIGPVIHSGRTGLGMPAFPQITKEQQYDIAEWLHQQVELEANRGTYHLLNIVTGNPQEGKEFFFGAGKCSTCHSVTGNGDLAHIGTKLSPRDIQQQLLYPRVNDKGITVTMPNGTTMAGTLVHLDDFNVEFWGPNGNYHSIPISKGVKVELNEEKKLAFHRQFLNTVTDAEMHNLTAYLVSLK